MSFFQRFYGREGGFYFYFLFWSGSTIKHIPTYCRSCIQVFRHTISYTGGILQRLDTDVHSAVSAKISTALWQRKRAQRCDSDGANSNVTALGHQWLWHRCDSDVYISVTAMATDTAVTALATDSAVSAVAADTAVWAMFTLVWQRWQLTVLWQRPWKLTALSQRWQLTAMCSLVWQRCQLPLLSQWCAHRCHTNVNIAVSWHRCHSVVSATAVTALSVVTAVTLVCTVVLQRCHCHRCCTVVSVHRWHTNVAAIAVTVLSLPLMLH